MILYNITINIDDASHDEWLIWMKEVHIPDVMNTGLFIENKLCKIHAEEKGGKAYSIQYIAKSWGDYETYQQKYAPQLQEEHTKKYKGKFAAFRTILEIVHQTKAD